MDDVKLYVQTEADGDLVEVLTGLQVAALLGVNLSRVRQLAGDFPAGRRFPGAMVLAGTWLIPRRDVDAFLATDRDRRRRRKTE